MLSGQRAMAHVLKRVYGCRYIPMKHIQTYVCMTALFNICYACTCANIRLSRTVCICIHTHTAYPVRLCVVSVYVSLLPQHHPSLSLYNICILTQLGPIVILFGRLTVSRSSPAVVYNMSGHRCRPGMYNASTYVSFCVCVCVATLTERIIEHPLGQTH